MNTSRPSLGLKAMIFAAMITAASTNANATDRSQQVSQAGTGATVAMTLPEVVIRPRPDTSWYYNPYTSGHAQRPSSLNHIPYQHYKVPTGYDADVAMHPYTSRLGPCIDASDPGRCPPVPLSHYERPPFNQ